MAGSAWAGASSSPRELLRPPPHRGPLIAAGAVLVTVGVALEEIRLADRLATGVHLAILALASSWTAGRARAPARGTAARGLSGW